MKKLLFPLIAVFFLATSCNIEKNKVLEPLKYLEKAEKFNIKDFFQSQQSGFAIILDNNDDIIEKFQVSSSGEWEGNKGTVKFKYTYNEDKSDARTWLITLDDDSNYTIVGHDFLHPAKGRQEGNVSELIYDMNYEISGQKSEIKFLDRIFQVDKNSIIIITEMTDKKGVKVGKIITSFSSDYKEGKKNTNDEAKTPESTSNDISKNPS